MILQMAWHDMLISLMQGESILGSCDTETLSYTDNFNAYLHTFKLGITTINSAASLS